MMPDLHWDDFKPSLDLTNENLTAPWIKVADILRNATLLRITAEGYWSPLAPWTTDCDPNGIGAIHVVADQLMLPDAPLGALIAKIGGSSITIAGWPGIAASAGTPSTPILDGKPFAVGTLCILPLPKAVFGPVFVGINSVVRPIRLRRLKVTVSTATSSA
jgi:hypothetical protein